MADRIIDEKSSTDAIQELSKPCPGEDCGYRIQKRGGCDHMICRINSYVIIGMLIDYM